MTLLETAAQADATGALVTGLLVFGGLLSLLAIVISFGSGRPHTVSERE